MNPTSTENPRIGILYKEQNAIKITKNKTRLHFSVIKRQKTYFSITTAADGISDFDHHVIYFLVSLPLVLAMLLSVKIKRAFK
jgi:hypothetical protein